MTSSDQPTGRRRRENIDGGRPYSHKVRVSAEEEAVLVRLAAERRVSVPRLLMESALSEVAELREQLRAVAASNRRHALEPDERERARTTPGARR